MCGQVDETALATATAESASTAFRRAVVEALDEVAQNPRGHHLVPSPLRAAEDAQEALVFGGWRVFLVVAARLTLYALEGPAVSLAIFVLTLLGRTTHRRLPSLALMRPAWVVSLVVCPALGWASVGRT